MNLKKISTVTYFYTIAVMIVIGLIAFSIYSKSVPSEYNNFAQCLTDNGVKMYGAWWCSHCVNQKQLFGSAFSKITYVECSDPGTQSMNQTCKDVGIEGYPTWEFGDASRASGEQTFSYLSTKSGCELPTQ